MRIKETTKNHEVRSFSFGAYSIEIDLDKGGKFGAIYNVYLWREPRCEKKFCVGFLKDQNDGATEWNDAIEIMVTNLPDYIRIYEEEVLEEEWYEIEE